MAEDTTSVSKGCFLIKKSSAHSPRKRRADNIFPEVAGESIAHRKQRYENFKKCWESIKCEIEVPVMCVILWCLQYSRPCILLMC